jgi:DNA-binding transcriptional ArsR family regulator
MEQTTEDEESGFARPLTRALAHPRRERIFAELNRRKIARTGYSEALGESPPEVAYHLRVLEKLAGLGTGVPEDEGEDRL